MNNRDKKFFRIARDVSLLSDFHNARVGAVVVNGKVVMSTGHNSNKTRTMQHYYNIYRNFTSYSSSIPKQHAEIAALSHLVGKDIDWSKISIYVYRELRNGTRACSRPCKACMALIKKLGIKNIYYIDENGNYVKEKIL